MKFESEKFHDSNYDQDNYPIIMNMFGNNNSNILIRNND